MRSFLVRALGCGLAALLLASPSQAQPGADTIIEVSPASAGMTIIPVGAGCKQPCYTTPSTSTTPTTPIETTPVQMGPGLSFGDGPNLGSQYAPSYIDSAIPQSQIRIRFDAMRDSNRPDRGEFFYPKCGILGGDATGPPAAERNIDSTQEISAYLEAAVSDRFSVFVEVPFRFINPQVNENESGLSDINAGFKYAFINEDCRVVTFQLRNYFDTGDGFKGLGTDHYSIEPAVLVYQQLRENLFLHAELRDWIAIGGSDFAGNVLRYGVGVSTVAYNSCNFRISPCVEMVGWTFLSGKELALPGINDAAIVDASGDTIINAKVGLRFGFENSDFAISWGRPLTGEFHYQEIARAEFRLRF